MPIFFFDVRCPMGLEPDETGLEFANAEVAYLKACEAIPDLTAELELLPINLDRMRRSRPLRG
ncbi:DUF6894 family protein, partial [Methylorubrum aminovorans]